MLDKLALTSAHTVLLQDAKKSLAGQFDKCLEIGSKYHQQVCVFKYQDELEGKEGGHVLTLHLKPRYPTISPLKIEINPSRFKSFEALNDLLSLFHDPRHFNVSRVDHTVDLPVSVAEVYCSLLFPRKQIRRDFRGNTLEGFYVGKFPELLCVYDKSLQAKQKGPLTRVELRQFGKKVPVQFYSELPELISYRPFERLSFVETSTPDNFSSINLTKKSKFLAEAIEKLGAQGAFKAFNKHSNFKRDFKFCLKQNSKIPDLDSIYQDNLKKYFQRENEHEFSKTN
jgi:hypothetical protein